ncbi:hypothetical protein JNK13_00175 [bacterium]|nr:hypothetical protein [bacterium]
MKKPKTLNADLWRTAWAFYGAVFVFLIVALTASAWGSQLHVLHRGSNTTVETVSLSRISLGGVKISVETPVGWRARYDTDLDLVEFVLEGGKPLPENQALELSLGGAYDAHEQDEILAAIKRGGMKALVHDYSARKIVSAANPSAVQTLEATSDKVSFTYTVSGEEDGKVWHRRIVCCYWLAKSADKEILVALNATVDWDKAEPEGWLKSITAIRDTVCSGSK